MCLSRFIMSTNDILLILGNQLFPLEYLKKTKIKKVFMAEDFGLTTHHKHHKLKILMFLWAMRQYRDELIENGYTVYYFSICLLYTSPSPRDLSTSRMPSSA